MTQQSQGASFSSSSIDMSTNDQDWTNHRASAQALHAAQARQKSGRRRLIDPTTCERDYSLAELEFMNAIQEYKKKSGRMFPTWSEVLEVLRALGYEKPLAPEASAQRAETTTAAEPTTTPARGTSPRVGTRA